MSEEQGPIFFSTESVMALIEFVYFLHGKNCQVHVRNCSDEIFTVSWYYNNLDKNGDAE